MGYFAFVKSVQNEIFIQTLVLPAYHRVTHSIDTYHCSIYIRSWIKIIPGKLIKDTNIKPGFQENGHHLIFGIIWYSDNFLCKFFLDYQIAFMKISIRSKLTDNIGSY